VGKIVKHVGGSYAFGFQFFHMGEPRVTSVKTEAQDSFDSFGCWNGVVIEREGTEWGFEFSFFGNYHVGFRV